MGTETKPFNIKLTEDERTRLEEHRVALGLRSHADVIRHWIAGPLTGVAVAIGPALDEIAANMEPAARRRVYPDEASPTGARLESDAELRARLQVGPTPSTPGSRLKKR